MAVRCSETVVAAFQDKLGTTPVAQGVVQEEVDKTASLLGLIPRGQWVVGKLCVGTDMQA